MNNNRASDFRAPRVVQQQKENDEKRIRCLQMRSYEMSTNETIKYMEELINSNKDNIKELTNTDKDSTNNDKK